MSLRSGRHAAPTQTGIFAARRARRHARTACAAHRSGTTSDTVRCNVTCRPAAAAYALGSQCEKGHAAYLQPGSRRRGNEASDHIAGRHDTSEPRWVQPGTAQLAAAGGRVDLLTVLVVPPQAQTTATPSAPGLRYTGQRRSLSRITRIAALKKVAARNLDRGLEVACKRRRSRRLVARA